MSIVWRFLKTIVVVGVIAILLAGASLYVAMNVLTNHTVAEVDIPSGASVAEMGERLANAGVTRTPHVFSLWVRLAGQDGMLKAGYYEFLPGMTLRQVADKIRRGEVKYFPLAIIEGWTLEDITRALNEQPFLKGTDVVDRFRALCHDRAFIELLGFSGVDSLEGYLFPDTYHITHAYTAEEIIRQLVARFHEVFTSTNEERAKAVGLTVHQVVTLASIVEKETGKSEERPLIASVFLNRLKLGMPLQSDPTVIYGLPHFDGNLHKGDLSNPHRYNTYVHAGLPPGPIASPGQASLEAVLAPAQTDYLYFVAKGDGSHEFTRTLAEHLRAVMQYQLQR